MTYAKLLKYTGVLNFILHLNNFFFFFIFRQSLWCFLQHQFSTYLKSINSDCFKNIFLQTMLDILWLVGEQWRSLLCYMNLNELEVLGHVQIANSASSEIWKKNLHEKIPKVNAGIPQGSLLVSTVFLLYTTNLPKNII